MDNMTKLGIDLEEMRNFKFKRVDLTDPYSVLNYGNDVIEIMSDIVSSLEKIMYEEDTSNVNILENIENMTDFDNELEQLQTKKNNQEQNGNFLEQLVNKILSRLPVSLKDNQSEKIDTYADLYAKYCDNMDNLCYKIIEDQTNIKNTMDTSFELLKVLEVLLVLLDNVIITGENDKNKCLKELNELEKNSINERRANAIRNNIVVFEKKLSYLRETLVINDTHYKDLTVENRPNSEILMAYYNFVKTTSQTLKLKKYDSIRIKQQADRLNSIQQLSKAVNASLIKDSETINENLTKAQQIGSSGFIDVDTLTALRDNTFKTLKELENYQRIMTKKRQANSEIVNGILEDLKNLGQTQGNLLTSAKINDYPSLPEISVLPNEEENDKSLKKKLGTMNND